MPVRIRLALLHQHRAVHHHRCLRLTAGLLLRDSVSLRPPGRLYTSTLRAGRIQSAERAVPTLLSIATPNESPLAWRRRTSGCDEGSFVCTSGDYPRTLTWISTRSKRRIC